MRNIFSSICIVIVLGVGCSHQSPDSGCDVSEFYSGPNSYVRDSNHRGVCFEFANNISVEMRTKLMQIYDPILRVDACVQKQLINGNIEYPSELRGGSNIFLMFTTRSSNRFSQGLTFYDGAQLSDDECTNCLLHSSDEITYSDEGPPTNMSSLGKNFYVTISAGAINRETFFRGAVTVENSLSPIRRFVFDSDLCAANTSTDPTDWVEIDADDNIVPIYGTGVT